MSPFSTTQSVGLRVRKMLGRSHLSANRLTEGVELYTSILEDYPEDLEAILILADLYLAADDYPAAGILYQRALSLDPTNENIQSRLEDTQQEIGAPSLSPTDPRAIKRLLQQLSGRPEPPSEEEVDQAARLMREILASESPAKAVALHLDEIDTLLPALLELNICQAYSDGRPDLAEGLTQLQTNIALQQRTLPSKAKESAVPRLEKPFSAAVQLLVANPERLSSRAAMSIEAIQAAGGSVRVTSEVLLSEGDRPEVIMAANPHLNPRMLENIALYAAARIPIVVDLDTDFEHMPIDHPDYADQALNSQSSAKAYTTALLLANLITVPTDFEAQMLQNSGYPAAVVPDSWSRKNRFYQEQARVSSKVNLGWTSSFCQFQDLLEIRRIVTRILHEFQDTQVVIVGDMNAYKLFDSLPLERRIFLPEVDGVETPLLLNQLDILLLPYRNIPFNCSLSDRPLMMAGAKALPWVASGIPSVNAWEKGGLVARSQEEWHANLRHLVMDASLRQSLGADGRNQAQQREVEVIKPTWRAVLENVITGRRPEPVISITSLP